MTDIVAVEGPLEPERLEWVGRLYGQADPKYRQRRVLEHLFVAGAAGPALHAFAIDGGEPVGHCAVVPMPARSGAEQLRCGKVEALFVSPSHRGRQGGGSSIAVSMREASWTAVSKPNVCATP